MAEPFLMHTAPSAGKPEAERRTAPADPGPHAGEYCHPLLTSCSRPNRRLCAPVVVLLLLGTACSILVSLSMRSIAKEQEKSELEMVAARVDTVFLHNVVAAVEFAFAAAGIMAAVRAPRFDFSDQDAFNRTAFIFAHFSSVVRSAPIVAGASYAHVVFPHERPALEQAVAIAFGARGVVSFVRDSPGATTPSLPRPIMAPLVLLPANAPNAHDLIMVDSLLLPPRAAAGLAALQNHRLNVARASDTPTDHFVHMALPVRKWHLNAAGISRATGIDGLLYSSVCLATLTQLVQNAVVKGADVDLCVAVNGEVAWRSLDTLQHRGEPTSSGLCHFQYAHNVSGTVWQLGVSPRSTFSVRAGLLHFTMFVPLSVGVLFVLFAALAHFFLRLHVARALHKSELRQHEMETQAHMDRQLLKQFLESTSHDMRTPLQAATTALHFLMCAEHVHSARSADKDPSRAADTGAAAAASVREPCAHAPTAATSATGGAAATSAAREACTSCDEQRVQRAALGHGRAGATMRLEQQQLKPPLRSKSESSLFGSLLPQSVLARCVAISMEAQRAATLAARVARPHRAVAAAGGRAAAWAEEEAAGSEEEAGAEAGAQSAADSAFRLEMLQVVDNSMSFMQLMLDNVVDASYIQADQLQLRLAPVDLGAVVSRMADMLKSVASYQRGVPILLCIADLPLLRCDGDRLARAVSNLVNNSIKYTVQGEIRVSLAVTQAPGDGTAPEAEEADELGAIAIVAPALQRSHARASRATLERMPSDGASSTGSGISVQVTSMRPQSRHSHASAASRPVRVSPRHKRWFRRHSASVTPHPLQHEQQSQAQQPQQSESSVASDDTAARVRAAQRRVSIKGSAPAAQDSLVAQPANAAAAATAVTQAARHARALSHDEDNVVWVRVNVTDTGCGMTREQLRAACSPCALRPMRGSGTGLGLYVCHNIVAAHGGRVHIESLPKLGTSVTLLLPLPVADSEAEAKAEAKAPTAMTPLPTCTSPAGSATDHLHFQTATAADADATSAPAAASSAVAPADWAPSVPAQSSAQSVATSPSVASSIAPLQVAAPTALAGAPAEFAAVTARSGHSSAAAAAVRSVAASSDAPGSGDPGCSAASQLLRGHSLTDADLSPAPSTPLPGQANSASRTASTAAAAAAAVAAAAAAAVASAAATSATIAVSGSIAPTPAIIEAAAAGRSSRLDSPPAIVAPITQAPPGTFSLMQAPTIRGAPSDPAARAATGVGSRLAQPPLSPPQPPLSPPQPPPPPGAPLGSARSRANSRARDLLQPLRLPPTSPLPLAPPTLLDPTLGSAESGAAVQLPTVDSDKTSDKTSASAHANSAAYGSLPLADGTRFSSIRTSAEGARSAPSPDERPAHMFSVTSRSASTADAPTARDRLPLRVLIVDDMRVNLLLMSRQLQELCELPVDTARDGMEALGKMKAQRFDAVFMDLNMPIMCGMAATRAYRDWERAVLADHSGSAAAVGGSGALLSGPLFIAAVSGDVAPEMATAAIESGCNEFLPRPLSSATLLRVLHHVARQSLREINARSAAAANAAACASPLPSPSEPRARHQLCDAEPHDRAAPGAALVADTALATPPKAPAPR